MMVVVTILGVKMELVVKVLHHPKKLEEKLIKR